MGLNIVGWQSIGNLPEVRVNHGAFAVNSQLYVVAGFNGSATVGDIKAATVDPSGNLGAWKLVGNLPDARGFAAVVFLNGYIYVAGGSNAAGTAQSTIFIGTLNADGTVDTNWSTGQIPAAMLSPQMVAHRGYLYLLGGLDSAGTTCLSTVYKAKINPDGSLGAWVATTSLPVAMANAGAACHNGWIYICGGASTTGGSTLTNVYAGNINPDGTISSWVRYDMGTARWKCWAIVESGNLYVLGGGTTTGNTTTAVVEMAKINADGSLPAFAAVASLVNGTRNARYAAWGGFGFVLGGTTSGGNTAALYRSRLVSDGIV